MPEPSDVRLLAKAAAGDRGAFETLYDRHAAILFGFLLRMLNDRGEAEDVLQETYIQTWRKSADYDPVRGEPLQWLTVIARTRALDLIRSKGARTRVSQPLVRPPRELPKDPVVAGAARSEDRARVLGALQQIPEDQSAVIRLAYFAGLSQIEIAERTGKPLGTVKTQTRLGLRKLRDLLEEEEPSSGLP